MYIKYLYIKIYFNIILMNSYGIEICYSLVKISDHQKDNKINEIRNEMNKLACETNGEFSAYDLDIALTPTGPNIIAANYNWKYKNLSDIKKLFNNLSSEYKILWINKYVNDKLESVIFSERKIADIKKFDETDKEIYTIVLQRLKC